MNTFAFNGAPLNGEVTDSSVQVVLGAAAYAVVNAVGRVVRNAGALAVQGRADVAARCLRAVPLAVDLVAQALVRALPGGVSRGAVQVIAAAFASFHSSAVRQRVVLLANASVGAVGRTARRARVAAEGRAQAVARMTRRLRAVCAVSPAAAVALLPRVGHAAPVAALAQAQVLTDGHAARRVVFDEPATAEQTFTVAFEDNVFVVR